MNASGSPRKFWSIVQVCLEEIYQVPHEQAVREIRRLAPRRKERFPNSSNTRTMDYHSQPLHVASDIARGDEPISDGIWEQYRVIVARFGEDDFPAQPPQRLKQVRNAAHEGPVKMAVHG